VCLHPGPLRQRFAHSLVVGIDRGHEQVLAQVLREAHPQAAPQPVEVGVPRLVVEVPHHHVTAERYLRDHTFDGVAVVVFEEPHRGGRAEFLAAEREHEDAARGDQVEDYHRAVRLRPAVLAWGSVPPRKHDDHRQEKQERGYDEVREGRRQGILVHCPVGKLEEDPAAGEIGPYDLRYSTMEQFTHHEATDSSR